MGHAISGGFLNAKSKEAALKEGLADAEEFAFYNVDRGENPSGHYHGNFRFYNYTFNTEDEAIDFFDSLGSYCDGVVIVKEPSRGAQSKYQKTIDRYTKKQQQLIEKCIEKFKERTSASIGCKSCKTRVSNDIALARRLRCPTCGALLIPDSAKEKLEAYKNAMKMAEEQLKKDTAETGKPRYYAKYEVHC